MLIERRNFVAEVVELEDGIVKRMEVKVSSAMNGIRVISRMLNGSEILGIHIVRNDNHAAGMLACGALYAHAAESQAVNLRFGQIGFIRELHPFLDKAESGLFGDGADCSRLENLGFAEELLSISVRIELIFA